MERDVIHEHHGPLEPESAAEALRAAGHSVGRTRRAVIHALVHADRPITAEELAADLDGVHESTVYRTLSLLESLGLVRHVHLAHGPSLWERVPVEGGSHHLVCDRCGRDLVVPDALFDAVRTTVEEAYGFVIDLSHFAVVGHCVAC